MNAASLNVAELYVAAFQQLAKTNNTLILPATCNDVTQMVGQAMTIYKSLAQKTADQQIGTSLSLSKKEGSADDQLAEYYSDDDEKPKHWNILGEKTDFLKYNWKFGTNLHRLENYSQFLFV